MNQATLADLQRRNSYPSITVLLNTTPGSILTADERSTAQRLIEQSERQRAFQEATGVRAFLATNGVSPGICRCDQGRRSR